MKSGLSTLVSTIAIVGCANPGGSAAHHDTTPPSATVAQTAPSQPAPAASPSPPALPAARESDTIATSHGDLVITPLHHATLLFRIAGAALYVDPVHDVSYDGLPKADAVFLTDIHPDHLDLAGLQSVWDASKTVVIAPPAAAGKLPASISRVTVMKNGDLSASKAAVVPAVGPWLQVEAVPAYNLTRGPKPGQLYHDKGRGNGYVLSFGDKRVYLSGDTECTPEMKALRTIDVAFVCMNLPYTMPPSEAAECIRAFHPKIVYPYHYRNSNLAELQSALSASPDIEVRLRTWY